MPHASVLTGPQAHTHARQAIGLHRVRCRACAHLTPCGGTQARTCFLAWLCLAPLVLRQPRLQLLHCFFEALLSQRTCSQLILQLFDEDLLQVRGHRYWGQCRCQQTGKCRCQQLGMWAQSVGAAARRMPTDMGALINAGRQVRARYSVNARSMHIGNQSGMRTFWTNAWHSVCSRPSDGTQCFPGACNTYHITHRCTRTLQHTRGRAHAFSCTHIHIHSNQNIHSCCQCVCPCTHARVNNHLHTHTRTHICAPTWETHTQTHHVIQPGIRSLAGCHPPAAHARALLQPGR